MDELKASLAQWFYEFWDENLVDNPEADILKSHGIDGDDGFDFIESFSTRFKVNIDNYVWRLHHSDEYSVIFPKRTWFGRIRKQPVTIPITTRTLIAAAETGIWPKLENRSGRSPSK